MANTHDHLFITECKDAYFYQYDVVGHKSALVPGTLADFVKIFWGGGLMTCPDVKVDPVLTHGGARSALVVPPSSELLDTGGFNGCSIIWQWKN